ncbi:hypothetical protein D3C72_832500 [compost metagenome]
MRMAVSRFCSCERSFWQLTTVLVGRCVMRMAVSTLFTFWPPAPPERKVSMRSSLGSMSSSRSASISGITSTPAKAVWRLPAELNGEMRTNRCVPFSACSLPKA